MASAAMQADATYLLSDLIGGKARYQNGIIGKLSDSSLPNQKSCRK